ncbi:hypothetical protein [Symbioplanes lichenis]|uniref:hypothetical protein n=1 Tax=Symbioplanes lichenis TaxID=1629072 RepID=UPI002738ED2D|nr:hypothetical protein [Actinoplanes lichenis]
MSDPIVDKLLAHLEANGDTEAVRELAGALRRGELDWPAGLGAPFYAEALAPRIAAFADWHRSLSDDDRTRHMDVTLSVMRSMKQE